jgi:hypothetical protein
MPTNMNISTNDTPTRRTGLQARWARFIDTVLPAPSPDRLVRVCQVSRTGMAMAEGSLADVGLSPVFQEIRSLNGDSQFAVLVSARDSEIASAVLQGI